MDIYYQALYGDRYYEGKEFEVKQLMEMKPSTLSDELKEALGMPDIAALPYLKNMQRYGPPLSCHNLKIPSHRGNLKETGKPHVDDAEPVDKTRHRGDLEEAEYQIEEEELEDGIESVESVGTPPSILPGIETPAVADLCKQ